MKIKLLFTTFLMTWGSYTNAQTTVTLQPNSSGKDAEISLIIPNSNRGDSDKMSPYAWTQSSDLNIVRPLIEFDLSSIPTNAKIIDAKLSLYFNPNYPTRNQHTGNNAFWVKRITSAWDEYTVTWNTQPTTTNTNQVSVPKSTSPQQNYPDINVTLLVQDMVNNPATSHGFMLQLQDESPYADVMLASSDNTNSALHPKLVISYSSITGINETTKYQGITNIYPNPFNSFTTIQLNSTIENLELNIYNLYGQKVITLNNISEDRIVITRDNLPNGVYFMNLTQNNKTIATDKLIITD